MKRKELVKALELVNPAVANSGLVPVFDCFMFDEATISGFNGDSLAIVAELKTGLSCAVDGKTLLGLMQNSGADEVKFSISKSDLKITAGKSNFKLPFIEREEFLFEIPDDKWAVSGDLSKNLLEGLEICLTTACRDQAMPAIMGICINVDEGFLYSCDGDAITRHKSEKLKGKGSYTIPNSFCDALLKIWHETEAVKGKIELSGKWAKATLNTGYAIYGRIISNENPLNHAELIETSMNTEPSFVNVPEGFNEALTRARVLADRESKPTVLTVYGGKLGLLTESAFGEARDDFPFKGHDDVEAFTHASLVQRSVNVCDELAIMENCMAFRRGDAVLQVVSNVGE